MQLWNKPKILLFVNSRRRSRVTLIDKIFNADLQQCNAYNPFSEKSKKMIQDMGNVELFELCETIPKVQCSECFLSWNQGIVYCTCGHLFRENESSQHVHPWRLDVLSIPDYVIEKKGRPRGARHGKNWSTEGALHSPQCEEEIVPKKKFDGTHYRFQRDLTSSRSIVRWTLDLLWIPNYVIKKGPHGNRHAKIEEQIKHHIAHNLIKRCIKRVLEGIHDRFQNDPIFRE